MTSRLIVPEKCAALPHCILPAKQKNSSDPKPLAHCGGLRAICSPDGPFPAAHRDLSAGTHPRRCTARVWVLGPLPGPFLRVFYGLFLRNPLDFPESPHHSPTKVPSGFFRFRLPKSRGNSGFLGFPQVPASSVRFP